MNYSKLKLIHTSLTSILKVLVFKSNTCPRPQQIFKRHYYYKKLNLICLIQNLQTAYKSLENWILEKGLTKLELDLY